MNFEYQNYTKKRYNSWGDFLKYKFSKKISKIVIDGDFGCPHRENYRGKNGCIYCSNSGAGGYINNNKLPISEQIRHGKRVMSRKYKAEKFIAYFQNYTNTFSNPEDLEKKYFEALSDKDVISLAISTRPDCLSDKIIEILSFISKKTYLWLELGVQTTNNKILNWLNRGHTYEDVIKAVEKLKNASELINISVHLIAGLPEDDFLTNIQEVNKLNINGIKFHMLHVLKNTQLEELYNAKKITLLTREEYTDIIANALSYLRPDILVQRLTSEGKWEELIAPEWIKYKFETLNLIDNIMIEKNLWQGINFLKKS